VKKSLIFIQIIKYTHFFIVLIGLNLISLPLAICQTLTGDNFVEQYRSLGFIELPSSSQLKIFYRPFSHAIQEEKTQAKLTQPIKLTVYIEGDGAVWRVRQVPPSDPTPQNPIAAYLALADTGPFVAYMGRPCMYLDGAQLQHCSSALWTDARFGKESLAISNSALDDLIEKFKMEGLFGPSRAVLLNLVGYSGGGVMAVLLASQRADVACLSTLAAPLDIEVWAKLQKVAPLSQSLNPAYPDPRLSQIKQMHWYGAKDKIVPPQSLGRYRNWNPSLSKDQVVQVLPNFNHRDYWVNEWPTLKEKACLN
jgi:hypothetical protein